jgi:hypothetical protein
MMRRFAGLGRTGREKLERARLLADLGFTPVVSGLRGGFLERRWTIGTPLRQSAATPASVDRMGDYLAAIGKSFRTEGAARVDDVVEMIRINVKEAAGAETFDALARPLTAAARFDEPAVALDGRMLPHEWIAADGPLIKIDAIDHHADDFFPGCRDIAWDVAGAIVEFSMTEAAAAALVRRYRRASGDAAIDSRIAFYRLAYLAYRVGYAALAAETLRGTDDGARFAALTARYRRSLEALAGRRRRQRAR